MRPITTIILWALVSLAPSPTLASPPYHPDIGNAASTQQTRHLPRASTPTDGKYFHEAGRSYALGHYDRRFFVAMVKEDERRQALRDLIRSYLTNTNWLGIETWIAHGTLLGWWWNGRIMPWDSDIDVQVTNATMRYMADHYNGTTFAYNYTSPTSGHLISKRYLLDVNPHFVDRTKGDGDNVIDARWIDTHTGLFIDITSVRERRAKYPGEWSCKNQHRYDKTDLWPLRTTQFEGVASRVPYNPQKVLLEEYDTKSLVIEEWEYHRWDEGSKDWVMMTEKDAQQREAENADRRKKDLHGEQ